MPRETRVDQMDLGGVFHEKNLCRRLGIRVTGGGRRHLKVRVKPIAAVVGSRRHDSRPRDVVRQRRWRHTSPSCRRCTRVCPGSTATVKYMHI